jgi:8-oxo-dGTP pyrophosphatase MutT (NUDIX family)
MTAEAPWQRLDSAKVFAGPWFEVRSDDVIQPNGDRGVYQHVVTRGSVTVLALDCTDRVVLTRQWIYTSGATQWRLPGGGIDPEDTDPLSAAKRELAEETGLRAANWQTVGQVRGADSLSNHVDHVFTATDLVFGTANPGPDEADLRVLWMSFDEALALVTEGDITHAGSAYGLLCEAVRRRR